MNNENEPIRLPSGYTIYLSQHVYYEHFSNFDAMQTTIFYSMMESGHYFPQIMQFIFVMIGLCSGYASFADILILNLMFGIGNMILWYLLKLYKIPGINTICDIIGKTLLRVKANWLAIIIVALFIISDWEIIPYSMISAAITSFIKVLMFTWLSNEKYNDKVAYRVSRFKT